MKFCPKCGSLLVPEKRGKEKYLVCPKCGYREKLKETADLSIKEKPEEERKKVVVFGKGEELAELPVTKIMCPKCGNDKAYWWTQQTRAADEPPTFSISVRSAAILGVVTIKLLL